MDSNTIYTQEPYQQISRTPEVKCPGKEISGLVFGINALVWGILALMLA